MVAPRWPSKRPWGLSRSHPWTWCPSGSPRGAWWWPYDKPGEVAPVVAQEPAGKVALQVVPARQPGGGGGVAGSQRPDSREVQ